MRMYIHGNCQARALAGMFAEALPQWSITAYEVFADQIIDEIETYRACLRDADVVLTQPIHEGYRGRNDLDTAFVRANARKGAQIVTIPALHFEGQLVGVRSLSYAGLGLVYQDAAFLACYARGLDLDRVIPLILSDSFYSDEQIEAEMRISLDETRRREAEDGIDVPMSGFLERHCFERQLFHAINHPYRSVLAALANGCLRLLGVEGTIADAGIDHLPLPHVPLCASVRKSFQRRGAKAGAENEDLDGTFLIPGRSLSASDFYHALADDLRRRDPAEIAEALVQSHSAQTFLARGVDLNALAERLRGGGGAANAVPPARLRWSPAKIEETRRRRDDPALDERERGMTGAVLAVLEGRIGQARDGMTRLFEQARERLPDDDWMFENLLGVTVACELFDLVVAILNARFREDWCAGAGVLSEAPEAMAVRWTVLPGRACRFDFFPAMFETDQTIGNLFHWSRSISLYHAYVTGRSPVTGHADVNLFDVGLTPGISFCDDKPGYFLVPDSVFLSSRGYAAVRAQFAEAIRPWSERADKAFWRGSTTGHITEHWRDLQRVRLCEIAQSPENADLIDAGLSGVVQISDPWRSEIEQSGLLRPPVPRTAYAAFRYQIDIDGNTNAWPGFYERLCTGSPVLKVASPFDYRQWFYDRLIPWWNYVPVSADMSDLVDKLQWLRRNEAVAREIGERGRMLALSLDEKAELSASAATISAAIRHASGRAIMEADLASRTAQSVRFLDGWAPPGGGERRMVGFESRLEIRPPVVRGGVILRIGLRPAGPMQGRLTVIANGDIVSQSSPDRFTVIDCLLPEPTRRRRTPIAVQLFHPDTWMPDRPADGVQPVEGSFALNELSMWLPPAISAS